MRLGTMPKMIRTLDARDYQVLGLLQADAKLPQAEIAGRDE